MFACVDEVDREQGGKQGINEPAGVPEGIRYLPKQQGIGIHEEIKTENAGNANADIFDAGAAKVGGVSPDLLHKRKAQQGKANLAKQFDFAGGDVDASEMLDHTGAD